MRQQLQRMVEDYRKNGAYVHEITSLIKLETGKPISKAKFFTGKNEPLGVDYRESGSNPFESGRGAILAIRHGFFNPLGGDPELSAGATPVARHNALSVLINTLLYEIKRGSYPLHKGTVRSSLDVRLPLVYQPAIEDDTNVSITRPISLLAHPANVQNVAGLGDFSVFFKNPLSYEQLDATFDLEMSTRDSQYVIDAELNNHLLGTTMLVVELPKK